ncbi:MAG: hypothetical protein HZA31_06900 [Opitutae bacterium]|nr:hypothetical protein [Opitutae bacterium]
MAVGWSAPASLPPLVGELAGKIALNALPGLPPLAWDVALLPADAGRLRVKVSARNESTQIVVHADLDATGTAGTWRLETGRFDAALWLGMIAPQFSPKAANLTGQGFFLFTGGGVIRDGRLTGRIDAEWRDGVLRDAVMGWTLDGVAFHGQFDLDSVGPRLVSAGPCEFTAKTISTARFGARNLFARGVLVDDWQFALAAGRVEIAGGEAVVDPCTLSLLPPVYEVNMHLHRVGLPDIVALAPGGLSDARGLIEGTVQVGWSSKAGLKVGAGGLTVSSEEPAVVRLAPTPGFLTKRVPERFELLPRSFGLLARWLAPKNPAFPELREIELGRTELQVKTLTIKLTPGGDSRGRSAVVQLIGRPVKADSHVELVTVEVALAGPLDTVLRFGLNQTVSVQMR